MNGESLYSRYDVVCKLWKESQAVLDDIFQESPDNPNPPFGYLVKVGDRKSTDGVRKLAAECLRLKSITEGTP